MALNPNACVFNPAWSGGGGGRGGGRGGGGGLGGGGGGRGGGFGGRGGDDVGRKRKREKKPLTESQLLMKEIGESCRFSDVERGMAAYRAAKVAGTTIPPHAFNALIALCSGLSEHMRNGGPHPSSSSSSSSSYYTDY